MPNVSDVMSIDVKKLIGQLPQDTLGTFEPASGVMYLNVDDATFDAWRATPTDNGALADVFHHELHHFIQTIATGYQFSLTLSFYEAFRSEFGSYRQALKFGWLLLMSKIAFWRSAEERAYRLALATNKARIDAILNLPRDRDPEDRSLMGAFYPRLFKKLEELHAKQFRISESGLSAADVIEGAAVGYEILVRHGGAEAAAAGEFLERANLDHLEHVPAFAVVTAIRTKRPAELLLAAAALALRFENPNDVLDPIAQKIAESPLGAEESGARMLEKYALRDMHGGLYLGTAVDVRRRSRTSYRLYDQQLDALRDREWGVDEIGLLTTREPLSVLPPGELGFAVVTRGSPRGISGGEASARLTIAATLLRHHSLRSYVKEVGLEMRDLLLFGSGR
ncbi:hypothetical protein [Ruegeria lacuscaerulensis]|uniref:hypothetical protein n=1 Tax=Ruegeria lacuscaerulensis TaxID=55218 RepID=UPI00147CC22B|nr:hypothetical protein [Ruegeria lacuscaerulensis]